MSARSVIEKEKKVLGTPGSLDLQSCGVYVCVRVCVKVPRPQGALDVCVCVCVRVPVCVWCSHASSPWIPRAVHDTDAAVSTGTQVRSAGRRGLIGPVGCVQGGERRAARGPVWAAVQQIRV